MDKYVWTGTNALFVTPVTYIVILARGCSAWRPAADMGKHKPNLCMNIAQAQATSMHEQTDWQLTMGLTMGPLVSHFICAYFNI